MITTETAEYKAKELHEQTSTGTIIKSEIESRQVTKTPLEVTQKTTDQRDLALKSVGYTKLNNDLYYKSLDDDRQKVKFITFNNNRVSVFYREHYLEVGNEIYNGPVGFLEDLEEYIN